MSKLDGKTAVVTGGSSGIGYATARKIKELGAKVIITGRNPEAVDKAAGEIGAVGLVYLAVRTKFLMKIIPR